MHNPIITFSVLSQKRGTSDRFAGNLSEVLRLSGVQEVNVYEAVDFLDEFY